MQSRFAKHRIRRVSLVALGVLAQLHLFLVVQLHHHKVAPVAQVYGQPFSTGVAQQHTSAPADPVCPACQISHRSAIYPAVVANVPFTAGPARTLAPSSKITVPQTAALFSYGRAPPLS